MCLGPEEITQAAEAIGQYERSDTARDASSPAQLWLDEVEAPPEDTLPVPSFGNRVPLGCGPARYKSAGGRVDAAKGPGVVPAPHGSPPGKGPAPRVLQLPTPSLAQSPSTQTHMQWSNKAERKSTNYERNCNNQGRNHNNNNNNNNDQNDEDEFPPDHTTVMIRHIACRLNRNTLQEALDQVGLAGTYDFVYLPLNCARRANLGYCFVNFISPEGVEECKRLLTGQTLGSGLSQKRCEVSLAHVQGREGSFKQNFLPHNLGSAATNIVLSF